jgi:tetratricopeptide (TPR) repeat protein
LLELRRYDEAVRAYNRYFADGGPAAAEVYRGRGQAHMKLRNYLGAVDDYTRALDMRPDADLHAHRGWAYFFSDAWKPALRDFQEALRLNPDHTDARIGRGLACVMQGQYREAVVDARSALRRKPQAPEMMHNIACILAQAAARVEADATEADRKALAAGYRREALDAVRQTLALVPAEQRAAFWGDQVVPDRALDPIRDCADFQKLDREFRDARPVSEDLRMR